jgi:hypothetical protein
MEATPTGGLKTPEKVDMPATENIEANQRRREGIRR